MAEIEYIWNLGQYEHVKWTGTMKEWDQETEETLIELGRQWYAAKGYVIHGRDNPEYTQQEPIEPTPTTTAQELIETELGGKVLEVVEHREPPAWAVPVNAEPKEWEKPTPKPTPTATDDGDDW